MAVHGTIQKYEMMPYCVFVLLLLHVSFHSSFSAGRVVFVPAHLPVYRCHCLACINFQMNVRRSSCGTVCTILVLLHDTRTHRRHTPRIFKVPAAIKVRLNWNDLHKSVCCQRSASATVCRRIAARHRSKHQNLRRKRATSSNREKEGEQKTHRERRKWKKKKRKKRATHRMPNIWVSFAAMSFKSRLIKCACIGNFHNLHGNI